LEAMCTAGHSALRTRSSCSGWTAVRGGGQQCQVELRVSVDLPPAGWAIHVLAGQVALHAVTGGQNAGLVWVSMVGGGNLIAYRSMVCADSLVCSCILAIRDQHRQPQFIHCRDAAQVCGRVRPRARCLDTILSAPGHATQVRSCCQLARAYHCGGGRDRAASTPSWM
jgi:hypothetical protein